MTPAAVQIGAFVDAAGFHAFVVTGIDGPDFTIGTGIDGGRCS